MKGSRRTTRTEEAAAIDALERQIRLAPDDPLKSHPAYLGDRNAFDTVVSFLSYATLQPVAPPPSLKERLMARIDAEEQARKAAPAMERPEGHFDVIPGVYGVSTAEAGWVDAELPGVRFKMIHHDLERGYTTRLVRFSPGVEYPRHCHGGTEEIFVLQGSVHVNGKLLKAGDYCRSEAGTWEEGTRTDEGAMAIVIASDADQIETPPPQ